MVAAGLTSRPEEALVRVSQWVSSPPPGRCPEERGRVTCACAAGTGVTTGHGAGPGSDLAAWGSGPAALRPAPRAFPLVTLGNGCIVLHGSVFPTLFVHCFGIVRKS